MKKYNIVSAKVYTKDGEQKKAWKQVGELIHWPAQGDKPESFTVELNMVPNEKFYVFEQKAREEKPATSEDVVW